jgi:hypothetical protein
VYVTVSQATELIAQQYAQAANVKKVWGTIIFNVKDLIYAGGAVGDGTTDDTSAVQAAVNDAVANNATLVFFPPGAYNVTNLTNTSTIHFIGDNATFVGYVGNIVQFGQSNVNTNNTNVDRFRNLVRTPATEQALVLVGDSITEGTKTSDYVNDGYAGIVRKAFQTDYGTKNYGFENLSNYGVTKSIVVALNGFTVTLNSNYYGGVLASSSVSGSFIDFSYTGKDVKIVYGGRADGGIINVYIDSDFGSPAATIDTSDIGSISNASISANIPLSEWSGHTIRLEKADNNPTDLCGVMFYNDGSTVAPILHNVGITSIALSDIPNNILDAYCNNGTVVLALGVNDQNYGRDINTFTTKLDYVANKMRANKGTLIFVDFMFSLPYSNAYKKAIRDTQFNYPEFDIIDFAQLWFSDLTMNKSSGLLDADGIHPTISGHEFIANTLMRHMGLPYTKKTAKFVPDPVWVNLPLAVGYGNFSSFQPAQYKLYPDGKVKLRGAIAKSGVIASNSTIATLPLGRRPLMNRIFGITSNNAYNEVSVIASNGSIVTDIAGQDWFSLEGIVFDID